MTPDRLLGRMTATMRVASWGVLPLGAMLGGLLAQGWGVRAGLFATACGTVLAPVILAMMFRSPAAEGDPGGGEEGGRG